MGQPSRLYPLIPFLPIRFQIQSSLQNYLKTTKAMCAARVTYYFIVNEKAPRSMDT